MQSVDEIQKQVESLEYGRKLGKKSEIKELRYVLLPNEKIIAIARGRYSKVLGSIVVTDSRVILICKNPFGDSKFEDFPYSEITSIENEKVPPLHLLGKIKINVEDNEASIDQMNYKESQQIFKLIRERVTQTASELFSERIIQVASQLNLVKSSNDDAFAKLEKLKELHTKKIITDEEYETKKNDLLSSI